LSPLEEDPGVQAMRAYLDGYAQAINADDFTIAALTDNSTPEQAKRAPELAANERGLQYPGPVPFTPIKLVVDTDTRKDVLACGYDAGYAVDPATKEPREPLKVIPWQAVMERVGDRWLLSGLYNEDLAEPVDCSGVTIQEVPW
jgi:hypothetical protein